MKVTQLSPQQRAELAAQSLTYDEVGATKQELPAAYGHLLRTVTLPADCDFERACAALRQWQVPLRSGVKVAASTPQVGQDEVVVLAIGLSVYVAMYWDRTWDVPEPDLHASTDPAVIARGEYIVYGPAHCIVCHSGSVEQFQRFVDDGTPPTLSGGYPLPMGPLGTLYPKNLTPDRDTGIARYTDPQLARMLRHGVRADGQASIPLMMPFSEMSDGDVVAVISFLRSLPAVRHEVPQNHWTTFGKVMRTFVAAARPKVDGHPPKDSPPQEATVTRGEYLARSVADCGGCLTCGSNGRSSCFAWTARAPLRPSHLAHGGRVVETVGLSPVQGGRREGYRTYSRKTSFPESPEGRWSVDVMTASGQLIGRLRFRVVP